MPLAATAPAQEAQRAEPASIQLTAAQLFTFADKARDAGDYRTAEQAYRALSANTDLELRTEARFRLGMMLADKMGRLRDAAVEFRAILDDNP